MAAPPDGTDDNWGRPMGASDPTAELPAGEGADTVMEPAEGAV